MHTHSFFYETRIQSRVTTAQVTKALAKAKEMKCKLEELQEEEVNNIVITEMKVKL